MSARSLGGQKERTAVNAWGWTFLLSNLLYWAIFLTIARTGSRRPLAIVDAQEKFDAEGRLTDKATRDVLSHFLQRFEEWTGRFST